MRRFSSVIGLGLSMVLAVSGAALAQQQRADNPKVTGGGQIIASRDLQGAGDTIAFYAEQTAGGARGEVQYVPTSQGPGSGTRQWHGRVTCLVLHGSNQATFAGYKTTGFGDRYFEIRVVDNGEGGNDLIFLEEDEEERDCEDFEEPAETLARGNLKVHNGG